MDKERAPFKGVEENEAILSILEGTSTEIGENFFSSLVENLSKILNTHGAWVTEYLEDKRRLRAKAFILGNHWVNNFEYSVTGTPCEVVVNESRLVHVRDKLFEKYKGNPDLKDFGKTGAVSYLGMPCLDDDGKILGHISVIDQQPILDEEQVFNIFRIFANRASAEMRRLRAEKEIIEKEEKLRRLFDSAMDGIIELDKDFRISRLNTAALKIFGFAYNKALGKLLNLYLSKTSSQKILDLAEYLDYKPEGEKFIWITEGLKVINEQGEEFTAEATLSSFIMDNDKFYTLIIRNINDKIEAEKKIESLRIETENLKEELNLVTNETGIIGNSKPLQNVLKDVKKVAGTEATVLILGETGTGKELIARSIHTQSKRADKPFVKVNCPAIPSTLIESEFFGHEQGAFTGATKKREGRFAIANGGTIFLDEIGELPIDLQSKLLRVLQEGEFEPVGSSRTIKVDVRVIAATNRDLLSEVESGKFREDLYYRLNVFQIDLPPLRQRANDIEQLSRAFADKFAKRNGIILKPLCDSDINQLKSYSWPGNIRELQNVIERAVITSIDGNINLNRALPATGENIIPQSDVSLSREGQKVLSDRELREFEKSNIINALENTGWKIAGDNGAAALLGLPTSTLNSKIKAFLIKKPK